jgi:NAD(P)-dependent dehydrogenase (short-subunit alcohol dehydrogenase family)
MSNWQTAFITGGASGIGRRIAGMLLARGCSVAVFDRSESDEARFELEQIAGRSAGCRVLFLQADVCDAERLVEVADAAVTDLGAPDLALNCAGIQDAQPFGEQTGEEFARVVAVNLLGSRNFAASVLPHMARGSQLAFIASLAGLVPSYNYSAYNASKFGVVGLAGALRLDCISRGIEVSVVCPPEVETPMVVEERKTMSSTGARLKSAAGTLQLQPACEQILAGLGRRRYLVIPGRRARLLALLTRLAPGVLRVFSERIIIAGGGSGAQ